jgi:hypothetical protein
LAFRAGVAFLLQKRVDKMEKNCIVAFIDILGYEDLMCRLDSKKLHKTIDAVFSTAEKFVEELAESTAIERKISGKLLRLIDFEFIGDAVIISLPMDEARVFLGKNYERLNIDSHILVFYFSMVTILIEQYLEQLHCLVRGGISMGPFSKQKLEKSKMINSKLLFGQALMDAHKLEQKALYPRILISEDLAEKWYKGVDSFVDKEFSGGIIKKTEVDAPYLDWYMFLKSLQDASKMFELFHKIIISQIDLLKDRGEERKLEKWIWFAKKHDEAWETVRKNNYGNIT